jgi:peptidoglycan/LPS O-acetylase OafA/YrhL
MDLSRRNLQLDVLRGLAILMVLACHSIFVQKPSWNAAFIRAGWSGVDLFFVVSGFLISGLLFSEYRKTGGIRFRRFAIRRAVKIYPAFYAIVVVTVAAHFLQHPFSVQDEIWRHVVHDFFFVQSYWEGTSGHFWSLSVEEHFYILLPLALFFMIRKAGDRKDDPFTAIPKVFVTVAAAVLMARLANAKTVVPFDWQRHPYVVPFDWERYLTPTHLRLDSLLFGVVISYWYHFHRERFSGFAGRYRHAILGAAGVFLSPLLFVSQYDPWMYTYGFVSVYLGYGCLLTGFLHVSPSALWRPILIGFRAIAHIGTYSYSIYLWHLTWLDVVVWLNLGHVRFLPILLFYVGAIGVGMVAGKLIEIPALRLRERLFPPTEHCRPIEAVVQARMEGSGGRSPACAARIAETPHAMSPPLPSGNL